MRTRAFLALVIAAFSFGSLPEALQGQTVKKGAIGTLPKIEIGKKGPEAAARKGPANPAMVSVLPDLVCSIKSDQFWVADGGTVGSVDLETYGRVYPPGIRVKIMNQNFFPGRKPLEPFTTRVIVKRDGAKIQQEVAQIDPSKLEFRLPLVIDELQIGQQKYGIRAVVDLDDDNDESNEGNNKCTFSFTVEW